MFPNTTVSDQTLRDLMTDREQKAWKALGRYKFWMFGYHAAGWVQLNNLLAGPDRLANPFRELVRTGKERVES